MPWRLIEVDEDDATDADITDSELISVAISVVGVRSAQLLDLTDSELIGVAVCLAHNSEPGDVYRRAWQKIQPQVQQAIDNK